MIPRQDQEFLKLLWRSPDRGDGWRSVSDTCWQLVEMFTTPELIEVDKENRRVRLTNEGEAVVLYGI